MTYEILACDIDGTLTNSDKQISPATKAALIRLQEEGCKMVLASGRSEYGFGRFADELRLDRYGGYALSFNGGKIINYQTKEVIYNAHLPQDVIGELHSAAVEFGVGILGYDKGTLISGNGVNPYILMNGETNYMTIKEIEEFPNYFARLPLNKCLMCGEPGKMGDVERIMQQRMGERISVYRSEEYFVELMPRGVDKAYSLSRLLAHLGLSRKQLVACGDGYNDVSMIQYAGMGVAMANANGTAKAAANYITTHSNDEDGIVEVVGRFFPAT